MPSKKGKHMKPWRQINHYAGFEFAHTQAGGQSFREKTTAYPNLAVAIETNQTAAVDQLLQHDYAVYPVNPVAAKSCRQRKAPSGLKTDHLDAWPMPRAWTGRIGGLSSPQYRRHQPGAAGKVTSGLKECQQVGVELVFVRFGEAVGCPRVDL
jgi:hypothetical protein